MDSPPRPRHHIPSPSSAPKRPRIPFPSSSASSSSQAAPDLAFHNYTSGLHPINYTNRLSRSQWFPETDFFPQPSVFSLPRMDPQWESSLPTSGSANLYANEAALVGLAGNSNALIPSTSCKWVDGRSNNGPELPTREVDGVVHRGIFRDTTSATQHPERIGPQVVGQPQIMHRYLRFEIAGACHGNSLNSWRGENAYDNSILLKSLCSSQQRGIFGNRPLVNPATMNSQFPPETITGMAGFTHYAANPNILAPGNVLTSEVIDTTKHSNQISPRKKRPRNRAKLSIGIEDRKHCRCKKSRCLKLYCKCFADDKHCSDACGCSDCNNNCENDGKLQEVRGQIQSRNPRAFVPKIVNFDTNSRGEGGKWVSPSSSGRHRRGCNCKKSTCQKKYCECYQANVGCSDVCRCEGCRNSYGRKADRRVERREIRSHGRLNMGAADQLFQRYQGIRDINQISPSFHTHTGATSSTQALANPRQLGFHASLYDDSQFVHQLPENVQAAHGVPRQRRVKRPRYSSLPPLRRASKSVSSTQSI